MSIDIIPINGKSQYFDYDHFEATFKGKIGTRCSDAKVFLLNNFPVSVSFETNIDLILIIAVSDMTGNFYIPKSINGRAIYFRNQIIPIKFVTHCQTEEISFENGEIVSSEGELLDYSNEINSIKFGLSKYLSSKCGFESRSLYIKPLVFIQNSKEIVKDHYLVGSCFDFHALHRYFSQTSSDIFISYREWCTQIGYSNLATDIERIADQASKDSVIGYLTKKKIERIGRQLSTSKAIYDELNKCLVIISGKAGTGKSSELLLLTMRCIGRGRNTLYLTYNKLLIFDISKTIKSFINANTGAIGKPGEGLVLTLHAFFYRLSKSLGVLHVLSAERIEKLLLLLKERMRLIYDFVQSNISNQIEWESLKTNLQNHSAFDIGTKEVGIDFINFNIKRGCSSPQQIRASGIEFFSYKKRIVSNIQANEVFLADYYGVLETTLLAIQDPQKYFDKYNLQDKYELLEVVLNLKDKHVDKNAEDIKIKPDGFRERKNRSIGGYRRKRTLFIDEAQDCHPFERDILISIYNSDNIVVANGGKEQLIRHVELCNWERSQTRHINVKKHHTRSKSYRVKKTVVDFCNFIGKKYQVDLNLEPVESEDEGELLFDFRQNHDEEEIKDIFNQLSLKGEVNGCTPYESLLVLLDSNTQRAGLQNDSKSINHSATINEYGNIEDSPNLKRGTWKHLPTLEHDFMFWDGTSEDKSQLMVPNPNESRVIYYESCRGLEAWSVVCFSLDRFFDQKKEDPDAERFLIGDKEKTKLMHDMFRVSNEDRKKMYAATWILMAMTRTIDSLYIQIEDKNSDFGQAAIEYLQQKNPNVRELSKQAIPN